MDGCSTIRCSSMTARSRKSAGCRSRQAMQSRSMTLRSCSPNRSRSGAEMKTAGHRPAVVSLAKALELHVEHQPDLATYGVGGCADEPNRKGLTGNADVVRRGEVD